MTDIELAASQTKWCIDVMKSKTPSREISIVITTLETAINLLYAGARHDYTNIAIVPREDFTELSKFDELGNLCFDSAMRIERYIAHDNPGTYGKKYYILAYTRLMEASAWLHKI